MKTKISIIPAPQDVKEKKGVLLTGNSFNLRAQASLSSYLPVLSEILKSCGCACTINKKDSSACTISLSLSDDFSKPESYILNITDSEIIITAKDKAGALYAIQSLKQLVMSNNGDIPCLEINDYPEFEWRGFLLDTCRYFFSVDFIKKVLDVAAFHKMNRFHWHLTDDQGWRFNVPEYPLLAKVGSEREAHSITPFKELHNGIKKLREYYYTDEMIKEVVAYAEKLCITIVPEVELPGHVSALLASYPEFGCTGGPYKVENGWGISKEVLCLGNKDITKIYKAAFKTFIRLFPGKWIHIGGDECPSERWKKCPKCQALKEKLGLDSEKQLQSWITKTMADVVLSLGKTPVGWDEVLDNTEKNLLDRGVIVQFWRDYIKDRKVLDKKHFTIMSPVTKVYLNYKNSSSYEEPGRLGYITAKKAYSFSPVEYALTKEERSFVLGSECCLWTEDLPSSKVAEYMMFPRFSALSECMWLPPEKKNFNRFKESLEDHKKRLDAMDILYYRGKLE